MTDWTAPTEFPDLSRATRLAVDTETKDSKLIEHGPGNYRARHGEESYMVGISVGTPEGDQWYFPFAHAHDPQNMPKESVIRWAKDTFAKRREYVGTNLLYDMGWLATEGIELNASRLLDVQVAEPLIDENARSYSLATLCEKYGTQGKDEEAMYQWQAEAFGGRPTRKQQAGNIWRTPSEIVGPYAESDVREPFDVLDQQLDIIEREDLGKVFDYESRLIPLLHAMRERGVLVDVSRAEEYREKLIGSTTTAQERLANENIDIWSQATIAAYCDRNGIEYNRTEDDKPSFPSSWLEKQEDIILRNIADVRRIEKSTGTFINSAILGEQVAGRIHCQFNQLRGDEYGTVSGRFSSSNPNLQNIPARDDELGPMIRSLFLPDEGDLWASDDWSQIEFRFLVHYAAIMKLEAAARTLQAYIDDPTTDFHEWTAKITGIERKPAKNINFGLVYGMGKAKLSRSLGLTIDEAENIFNIYHGHLPFVKKLLYAASKKAGERGHIKTWLGRRRRYNTWEPTDWNLARETSACAFEQAKELWVDKRYWDKPFFTEERAGVEGAKYGGGMFGIKRAKTFTALNALLQGSAADLMKVAMVEIWESGVCDVLGAPLLTVHDELNWSMPDTKAGREAHEEAVRIMGRQRDILLPLLVSSDIGHNWSEAK